jgi:hypothetical protein
MENKKTQNFDDKNWEDIKEYIKGNAGNEDDYYKKNINWKFPINSINEVEGKPQLIENIKKNIVLARETILKTKENKEDIFKRKIVLFDEFFDKRYSGQVISTFKKKFFIYRIIDKNKEQHYLLSENELPNEICKFKGMSINADDFAEMSKSMKLECATPIFFVKEFKSSIQTIPPKEIIEFVKARKMNEENWLSFLAYHKTLNSYNRFPKITEVMKSAFILSGKVDGYPLHLGVVGLQGSRKSKGFIETIAQKMSDAPEIVEGANSRIKGLTPSFKEKPANLGYFANCNRMGWVDEIGKMIEFEMNRHDGIGNNILGEANFLFEHTTRQVSSGNDNTAVVKANSKFIMVLNPIKRKTNISQHVGTIDPTTMSRILWWVQDKEEYEFAISEKGIIKIRDGSIPKHPINSVEEFLTLYDSCNAFNCKINYDKLRELKEYTLNLVKDKMADIWKPRAEHHIELLIDGICKHRCLFIDYDENFEAKDIDYETTKAILTHMIIAWETEFRRENY